MKKINKFMIYWNHYQNILHFAFMNIFITNGIFLTTRTLLHTKLWAPSLWLQLDRIFCLIVFYFYWSDLVELLTTSLYVNFRADDLSENDQAQIDNAKALLTNFGKDIFYQEKDTKNSEIKTKRDSLPLRVPLD